jgi:hypothetical protein
MMERVLARRLVLVALLGVAPGLPYLFERSAVAGGRDRPHGAFQRADFSRTIALAPDTPISVEATAGEIRITGHDRADAAVTISTDAPTAALKAALTPSVTEEAAGVRITARQADNGMDPTIRSVITLDVPRSARLEAVRLLTGRIVLANLDGRVAADVTRGSLTASRLSGTLRLETGTGDLTLEHARLVAGGLIRLRAFNGNVTLQLDERPADARILALSFNGRITSDIPLAMKDRFGPRFGEATLGKGEPVVSIDTVMGNIVIRTKK